MAHFRALPNFPCELGHCLRRSVFGAMLFISFASFVGDFSFADLELDHWDVYGPSTILSPKPAEGCSNGLRRGAGVVERGGLENR